MSDKNQKNNKCRNKWTPIFFFLKLIGFIINSKIIKIVISSLLLFYVLHKSGLFTIDGLKKFQIILSESDFFLLSISIVYIFIMEFTNAFKWYCLSKAIKLKSSYLRLLNYCFVGRFYNLILPSNIGGDLIRIRLQGNDTGMYAQSAATVFIERLTGIITLVALSFWVVLFHVEIKGIPYVNFGILVFTIGVIFLLWCVFDSRVLKILERITKNRSILINNLYSKISKFHASVIYFKKKPRAIFIAFLNSLLFYFAAIINSWIAALVFDGSILFSDMVIATPLIMILLNLPISIGGIGLLEFSNVLVLGYFDISPSVALSVALLIRLKGYIAAGIGYILNNFNLSQRININMN